MTEAPDFRTLRSGSHGSDDSIAMKNQKFIKDTIFRRIYINAAFPCKNHAGILVESFSEKARARCHALDDVASYAADSVCSGDLFSSHVQMSCLARLCGCEKDPNRIGGVYSSHEYAEYYCSEDLQMAITKFFTEEFAKIEKEKEELGNDTAKYIKYGTFQFVLNKDSEGLKAFLDQLPRKSSRRHAWSGNFACAAADCVCNKCKPSWEIPNLADVLLASDDNGWTPLRWAAEVGSAECIAVILDASRKTDEGSASNSLFIRVLHARDNNETPSVFVSVYRADVECILAFLHAGADLTTACGGLNISILEYLVHLASAKEIESTYFPVLEIVLKFIMEKKADFNLTAPIYYKSEETDGDAKEEAEAGENGEGRQEPEDEEEFYRAYEEFCERNERYIPGFGPSGFTNYYGSVSRPPAFSDERMVFGWSKYKRRSLHIHRYKSFRGDSTSCKGRSWTLLNIAVDMLAVDVVKLLLDAGADPNYRLPPRPDQTGASTSEQGAPYALLADAMESESLNVSDTLATLRVLLDGGADINATRPNKLTALHVAAEGGLSEAVVFLLQNNVDLTLKNKDGKTAAQQAERRRPDLAELLTREVRLQRLVDVIGLEKKTKENERHIEDRKSVV